MTYKGGSSVKPPGRGLPSHKAPEWWNSIGASLNKQSQSLRLSSEGWMKNFQVQTQNWQKQAGQFKFHMPVQLDVEFMNPIFQDFKRGLRRAWNQLPPPAQVALPFIAASTASGVLVYKIQNRKLVLEREKNKALLEKVDKLSEEKNGLQVKLRDLRAHALAPRSASELKMATAVAEATTAAAAAASAAASAASACSVQIHVRPKSSTAGKRADPAPPYAQ